MTKAEFDYGYTHQQIAVHMPTADAANFLLSYVNNLLGVSYEITWDINEFPYLFYLGDRRQTGWTGTGAYNEQYTKITYEEFFAAINDLQEIIDVDFEDMTEIL